MEAFLIQLLKSIYEVYFKYVFFRYIRNPDSYLEDAVYSSLAYEFRYTYTPYK